MFVGILKKQRREGKDLSRHKESIAPEHVKILYEKVFSTEDAWGLLFKVFYEINLHFIRRGREGLRDLNKNSFEFHVDPRGVEYVIPHCNETEKTKQGSEKEIIEKSATMYAQVNDPNCPVASLRKYLSKLNPKCSAPISF